MKQVSRGALSLAAALAAAALAGCGGTSDTAPSMSFPIGGTTPVVTGGPPSTTPTSAPTTALAVALTAEAGSGGGCITLTWTVSNAASPTFDVLRMAGGATTTLASGQSGTRFVDVGLTPGTAYQYEVVAHGSGGSQGVSNIATGTPFGPTAAGFGDPPSVAAGPDALFIQGAFALTTSAGDASATANYFTLALTLSRTAQASDLQNVQYQGTIYSASGVSGFAKGITATGNQLSFDSRAAGIVLDAKYRPVVQAGYYSLRATVAGSMVELTAPAGFAGSQPNTSTFTDTAGRVFSFSISNSL